MFKKLRLRAQCKNAYPAPVLRWRQGPVMSGFLTFMDRYRDEAACIAALPPVLRPDLIFPDALRNAIAAGVCVFFSAGNYHELTGHSRGLCNPTSIWFHKGREDLLSVGACKIA
jgi:hypothetical protein